MVEQVKNLYEILGVKINASADEIKAAYKKLVRIYHPDINKSKEAEINFKILNNAYEILSDIKKRENYDNLLKISGVEFEEKRTDLIYKTPYKEKREEKKEKKVEKEDIPFDKIDYQNSIIKEIKITKKEALIGTKRTVNILNKQICPKCHGKKFINSSICAFCHGEGEKKEYKKTEVEIKKGVIDGDYIYVGKVNTSAVYDKNLFLKIKIEPYKKMFFEENNILIHIELNYEDLILGKKLEVAIEEKGITEVVIPPMTAPDTRIKLDMEERNVNYYAVIKLNFPSYISQDDKILYDRIRKNRIGEE